VVLDIYSLLYYTHVQKLESYVCYKLLYVLLNTD